MEEQVCPFLQVPGPVGLHACRAIHLSSHEHLADFTWPFIMGLEWHLHLAPLGQMAEEKRREWSGVMWEEVEGPSVMFHL